MQPPVIIYLSPFDLLRPRTNQVADVRFSEGFAQAGCEVHIITPFVSRPDNIAKEQLNEVYGLEATLQFHFLPVNFKKDIKGILNALLIAILDLLFLFKIKKKYSTSRKIIVISRHTALLLPIAVVKKTIPFLLKNVQIIHWSHDLKYKLSDRLVYKASHALFFTNSSIRIDLLKTVKYSPERTAITLNPITEKQAAFSITKAHARTLIGRSRQVRPLVVYTGKLGLKYQQEIIHILEAAGICKDVDFLLTGGSPEVVNYWQDYCKKNNVQNITFTGYISNYQDIQHYQYSADILITYYTRQGHDPRYNLPNKLCEYMLTGNIIITPDYPATADLLNPTNCLFCEPESSKALADAIQYAVANPQTCEKKAAIAAREVREITFKRQATRLLAFIQDLT